MAPLALAMNQHAAALAWTRISLMEDAALLLA